MSKNELAVKFARTISEKDSRIGALESQLAVVQQENEQLLIINKDNATIGRQAIRRLEDMLKANDALEASLQSAQETLQEATGLLRDARQLMPGWREAVTELEDFCSEPVRLKNMLAAADQIDDLRERTDAILAPKEIS